MCRVLRCPFPCRQAGSLMLSVGVVMGSGQKKICIYYIYIHVYIYIYIHKYSHQKYTSQSQSWGALTQSSHFPCDGDCGNLMHMYVRICPHFQWENADRTHGIEVIHDGCRGFKVFVKGLFGVLRGWAPHSAPRPSKRNSPVSIQRYRHTSPPKAKPSIL